MNNFLRLVLAISLLVIGSLVISQFADNLGPIDEGLSTQALNTCGGLECDRVDINRFYVRTDGFLLVSTSADELGLSCTPQASHYLKIHNTTTNFKETYTLLLAAKLNELPVTIRMKSDCTIDYTFMGAR